VKSKSSDWSSFHVNIDLLHSVHVLEMRESVNFRSFEVPHFYRGVLNTLHKPCMDTEKWK
jgi:hypothetical protein